MVIMEFFHSFFIIHILTFFLLFEVLKVVFESNIITHHHIVNVHTYFYSEILALRSLVVKNHLISI